MVAPDPDPRDADVDPPGIGLTVTGGRGWRVGRRRAHSLRWAGRIRYSLVRWCCFFFTIRRPPGTTLTENDVDLAVSLSPWCAVDRTYIIGSGNVARRDFGSAHGYDRSAGPIIVPAVLCCVVRK